jgi:FkbM family methyltransferase
MLLAVAEKLDSLGFRSLVAKAATLAYLEQSFSVDSDGHWINRQDECVIVSPSINTKPYSFFRDLTLDEWCRDYRPRAGDTVVDLGSGVGEEVIILSKLVGPDGLVIAVEAHPETYRCLEKTVARSGLTNVRPVHCAIADVDGTANINTRENHLTNTIIAGEGDPVPQLSLETLCQGLERVDFLRSNIEGAERLAIQGPALAKVRNASISCHDFVADAGFGEDYRSLSSVRAQLERAGFSISMANEQTGKPWLRYHVYAGRVAEGFADSNEG